jgi:Glutathione S-transferase, C-terminal domain
MMLLIGVMDVVAEGIACALQNWRNTRRYEGSLAIRKEGFTEDWGDRGRGGLDDNDTIAAAAGNAAAAVAVAARQNHDDPNNDDDDEPLQLFQYRPAWTEQLLLKLAGLSFRVVNSRYAVNEVTGALPCLRDGTAMAGGHDDIVAYLKQKMKMMKLPESLLADATTMRTVEQQQQQQPDSSSSPSLLRLTVCWIQNFLTPALHILRYSHGADRWQRAQINEASRHNYYLAALQMWTERVVLVVTTSSSSRTSWMINSTGTTTTTTTTSRGHYYPHDQALDQIRHGYQLLNDQLAESSTAYLLGTNDPTYVDCLLWGHLMEAVTNRHLITVLSDYRNLVTFVQTIYTRYHFGAATGPLNEYNVEENAANAFGGDFRQILAGGPPPPPHPPPVFDTSGQGKPLLQAAVDAAHRLRRADEAAAMTTTKKQQQQQQRNDPLETWHRWRRGGTRLPAATATSAEPGRPGTDKEASSAAAASAASSKFHDDVWLISVVTATLALVLGVGFRETA